MIGFSLHFLPTLGIIGYFCEIEWMIWAGGIIAIILNVSTEVYSKKPKVLSLYVVATIIIGIIYSFNADVPWWFAIITVASFTYITWQICSWIIMIAIGLFIDSNKGDTEGRVVAYNANIVGIGDSITVNIISPVTHHYIESVAVTQQNIKLIENWIDAETQQIYIMEFFKEGKPVRNFCSKEMFEQIKKEYEAL